MKFDMFTGQLNGNGAQSVGGQWVQLIKDSPHWPELQSKNFSAYPNWIVRAAIIPGTVSADEEDGKIFISEFEVGMEREVMNLAIDPVNFPLITEA